MVNPVIAHLNKINYSGKILNRCCSHTLSLFALCWFTSPRREIDTDIRIDTIPKFVCIIYYSWERILGEIISENN